MDKALNIKAAGALAAALGLALGGCANSPSMNRSLSSVRQPVVERTNYALDVATGYDGIPVAEQRRLADWFETMGLAYGDRLSLDDASANPAVREQVAAIAGKYGLLVSDGSPVTEGFVEPGRARVVVTRTTASVPGCPDWSGVSIRSNQTNETDPNYGCATNGNLAAMVADPEDLIAGKKGLGDTTIVTSTKAIKTYRDQTPTGSGGLPATSSKEGGS